MTTIGMPRERALANSSRETRGIVMSAMKMTPPKRTKIRPMQGKWPRGFGWKIITFLSFLGWAAILYAAWLMS